MLSILSVKTLLLFTVPYHVMRLSLCATGIFLLHESGALYPLYLNNFSNGLKNKVIGDKKARES